MEREEYIIKSQTYKSTIIFLKLSTITSKVKQFSPAQLKAMIEEILPQSLSYTQHKIKGFLEVHVKVNFNPYIHQLIENKSVLVYDRLFTIHSLSFDKGDNIPRNGNKMARKIFVHNIPGNWTNMDLEDLFSHYGVVEERYICFKEQGFKKKKNIGFVIFQNRKDAEFVCSAKTIKYNEAIIRVKWATSKEDREKNEMGGEKKNDFTNKKNKEKILKKENEDNYQKKRFFYLDDYKKFIEKVNLKPTSKKYFTDNDSDNFEAKISRRSKKQTKKAQSQRGSEDIENYRLNRKSNGNADLSLF